MKKITAIILALVAISISAFAQNEESITVHNEQTGADEVIDLPEGMTKDFDTLLQDWHSKNFLSTESNCQTTNENPTFCDSVYMDRLSRIPSIMELSYNEVVRKFIEMYSGRLRNSVAYMLGASNFYMPIFEEALDLYNLPQELKYLPIIESALNPSAISRAGASGLWQFMIGTGKIYNLESNSLIDERRDPIKATYAAVRYLKDLYAIYEDWNLVIAAYNCGPGNVNKAIHRANGATDYWEIYNYLPRETRGYVPGFIAANYIMTYYCEHNICPMEAKLPTGTDTIRINQDLHFQQITELCNIDIEAVRALNPQYKMDIIPGNSMPCTLRLPRENVSAFINTGDSIYAYRANELFKKRRYTTVKNNSIASSSSRQRTSSGSGSSYHKIKKGETLSSIARKHGVSVNNLKKWNNIQGTNITAGKQLKLHQ